MDSSPVLRQQSKNKIHTNCQRMKNEHNKMPDHPKSSKSLCAPHLSGQDENKDPQNSEICTKTPVRPGGSRLPVLAKSLRLQTSSDFSQSHCQWEDKPLAGKAKKKKPCTRPIPFNLSHSRVGSENEQPPTVSQSRSSTRAVQHNNKASSFSLKTPNGNANLTKHLTALDSGSTKGTGKPYGKAKENISQLSQKCGPLSTFKSSTTLSHLSSSTSTDTMHQNSAASSAHAAVNAKACVDNMNLLSLNDPTKTSHALQTDKGENFQFDHAALLSILRNEGVSTTGLESVTPKSKPYNYLPQRVSVMKSRQKVAPPAGLMKSEQFSPDPTALQSILQNEGVKVGGLAGVTPRSTVRPSGRVTSVYTAQRVPARKQHMEAHGGPAVELKETSVTKWTPQRVRNTRHQPMSAMKWHLSAQPSPCGVTPGLRSNKTNQQPCQDVKTTNHQEVVQRLFDDQEDERSTNVTDKVPETHAEHLPVQTTVTRHHSEEKVKTSRANSNEEEQKTVRGGPFIQAPQRESVIFFSTSKKLLRAPHFEQHESSSHHEQHGPVSSERKKVLPANEGKPSVSEPTCQTTPETRELIVQKTFAQSCAVAMLRKRFPPLEELRMDEEVATYTSSSVLAACGLHPPRPRCGNPLASILHFEDSTRFVPIGFELSSDPPPSPSSPLKER